jgi:hypothetical protein
MRRTRELGEGKLGGLILLVLLLAAGVAAWNVVPVYYDHYDLTDKVVEICRAPRHVTMRVGKGGDDAIMTMLMDEVSKRRMTEWIGPESFQVTTTDHSRQIDLYYERETEILPGWKHTFKFAFNADQPLI